MTPQLEPPEPPVPARASLPSDALLEAELTKLLTTARVRRLWVFYLDSEHRIQDPVLPMEDLPESPLDEVDIADLGLVTPPELLIERVRAMAQALDLPSFALVWERAGNDKFSQADLAWARGFAGAARDHATSPALRAIYLLHSDGLRQFAEDDLLG